jgi:DNA-binding HxlR family transcriptional regulator
MISSSVLSERVRELRGAGILAAEAYVLTDEGRQLLAALAPLEAWAQRWARRG